MRQYLVRGGNTYPKARSCPNGRQRTDIKMSCLGTVVYAHPCIDQDEVA